MTVYFAQYLSHEMLDKFDVVSNIKKELNIFFEGKYYGNDVEILSIGTRCMNPIFESAFPSNKPKYNSTGKILPNGDKTEDKALSYDLILDYKKYLENNDIRFCFAQDTLQSLDIINSIKKLKDFELAKFKSDFETFFKSIGWI